MRMAIPNFEPIKFFTACLLSLVIFSCSSRNETLDSDNTIVTDDYDLNVIPIEINDRALSNIETGCGTIVIKNIVAYGLDVTNHTEFSDGFFYISPDHINSIESKSIEYFSIKYDEKYKNEMCKVSNNLEQIEYFYTPAKITLAQEDVDSKHQYTIASMIYKYRNKKDIFCIIENISSIKNLEELCLKAVEHNKEKLGE